MSILVTLNVSKMSVLVTTKFVYNEFFCLSQVIRYKGILL